MDNLSETVKKFLAKLCNVANEAASRGGLPPRYQPWLGYEGAMLTLYRGHTDMPIELEARSPSTAGAKALEKMKEEIGEKMDQWALTDETAARLIELIDDGQIRIKVVF